jgi:hypothetical protein
MNAAPPEKTDHNAPATMLAVRFPNPWTVASSSNAEPLSDTGASVATAACSAVSTAPIAKPASAKLTARTINRALPSANPTYPNPKQTMPEFAWELSLGVYLIVKGFKPAPIISGQAGDGGHEAA